MIHFEVKDESIPMNVENTVVVGSGGNGQDGFSPIANVTQTDNGAIISITDKTGTTTATVNHGKDGQNGKDGRNGSDGYTPQKGVDYYTEADKQEIVEVVSEKHYTKDEIDQTAQEFINEINDIKGYVELVDARVISIDHKVGDIDTVLDSIITLQENYIGGGVE